MLDKCGNIIVGLVLIIIVCILLGLNEKDIIIVVLISLIVVFGFMILDNTNKYYHKRMNDLNNEYILQNKNNVKNKLTFDTNDDMNNNTDRFVEDNTVVRETTNNKEIPYHLQDTEDAIIPADKYNLEDCTTDKTCIQKPDIHNLYQLEPEKINNIKREIVSKTNNKKNKNVNNKNLNNNNVSKKNNKLVIEDFEGHNPQELNDVVLPYAEYNIDPFAKQDNFKTTNYTELVNGKPCDINDNLCFHCKVGECQGGVCKDLNEVKLNNLAKKIINESRPELPHPFSDEFPVIRVTNDEVAQ